MKKKLISRLLCLVMALALLSTAALAASPSSSYAYPYLKNVPGVEYWFSIPKQDTATGDGVTFTQDVVELFDTFDLYIEDQNWDHMILPLREAFLAAGFIEDSRVDSYGDIEYLYIYAYVSSETINGELFIIKGQTYSHQLLNESAVVGIAHYTITSSRPQDPMTYTVTVAAAQHGKVTASPASGEAGTKVTLTVTPDSGYELDTLTVKQTDGKAVPVAADNTFTLPASDVTVSATFKALPVDSLSLSKSAVSVSVGGSVSVTATVSGYAGKHVYAISSDTDLVTASVNGKTIQVRGVAQGAASVYVVMVDTEAVTVDQAKADPSMKELKVTVTKATSGGPSGGSAGGSTKPTTPTTPGNSATEKPASQTFGDVEKGSWYESGVTFVVSKGLFNGVGANQFAPNTNMTRGMLMTVLARLAGQSTDGGATWYSKGMDWAKAQGISDGTAPDGNITREQLVTMLYRYAKSPKVDAAMGMAGFEDVASISAWAQDAMRWAVQNGILTGKDGGRLDPQGTATRAEVATILQRYVEKG